MTGMEHVVREVAFALGTYHQDEAAYLVPQARVVVQHLAEKGLIAPAPLREEWAVQWVRRGGEIRTYPCDDEADARDCADDETTVHRYVSDWMPVNPAEGDGRADRPSWVDEHGINHADGDGGRW